VEFINKCKYKKVMTLSEKEVKEVVMELLDSLEKRGMKSPSYIISILNAGKYIGDIAYLRYKKYAEKREVLLRRSVTEKKDSKFIRFVLKSLPYFVLNVLRNLEECFLQLFFSREAFVNENQHNLILQNFKDIRRSKISPEFPILIVDDAIDSGTTIKTVEEVLVKKLGIEKSCIKILAIVKTRENSIIEPDAVKYRNVLIRFPWSKDFKG
jgi:hypoxanthine-guanine phosphoribosyltransferase